MKNWNRKYLKAVNFLICIVLITGLIAGLFGNILPVSARTSPDLTDTLLPKYGLDDTMSKTDYWKPDAQASIDLTYSINLPALQAGQSTRMEVVLENTGTGTLSHTVFELTLPAGLNYVAGSTRWRQSENHVNGGWFGPSPAYDPNPIFSPVQWSQIEISGLSEILPGDYVQISFEVEPNCLFSGGDLELYTITQDVNGWVYGFNDSVSTTYSAPSLNVTLTSNKSSTNPIGLNESISWDIQVRNTDTETLDVVWVEVDLGTAFTYDYSTGDATYGFDSGTVTGQTVAWELTNLPAGATANLFLRAISDSYPCDPDIDLDVYTSWGIGTVDGSSGTKPGIDIPDTGACLSTAPIHSSFTGTREPNVAFIGPTLSPTQADSFGGSATLIVGVENNGSCDAYDTDLVITLPSGLTYEAATSRSGIGVDSFVTSAPIADPAINGNELTYYDKSDVSSDIFDSLQAAGGNDTGLVSLSLNACDAAALSEIDIEYSYYSACLDTQYILSTTANLTVVSPQIDVSQTFPTYLAPNSSTSGHISITNNGTSTPASNSHLTTVETLQSGLTYVSGTTMWRVNSGAWHGPDAAYDPTISGNDLTWTETILGFSPDTLIPNASLEISFEVASDSGFSGSDLDNSTSLHLICDFSSADKTDQDTFTLQLLPTGPNITTDPASSITNDGAILNGTVNAIGESTDITFEYGLTNAYGTSVIADKSPLDTSTDTPVTFTLTNLAPNTEYHYRVVGVNTFGTTNGFDQTFTTLGTTIMTEIHSGSIHTPITFANINDSLHAMATVVGNGPQATGVVNFTVFHNPSCSGTGIDAGSIPLDAGGVADPSTSATLTNNGMSFIAHYLGDSNYLPVDGTCTSISTNTYPDILPLSIRSIPQDSEVLSSGLSTLVVQFNQDVLHGAPADPDSADNPLNYLLVEAGLNGVFDTIACGGSGGGLQSDDTQIAIDSVSYDSSLFTASLGVNNGSPLPNGSYQLFVCGTTSIVNTDRTVYLNNHLSDSVLRFDIQIQGAQTSILPATGFAPDRITILPEQSVEKMYNQTGMEIQIPAIGVLNTIVGVPGPEWDVSWLGNDIGYLQGTAFPTWNGNTVLTGHVANVNGKAGPFAKLEKLTWGDRLIVHAWGQQYIYEVRTVDLWMSPEGTEILTQHEEFSWLTLITCHGYDETEDSYRWRTIVRAVLVDVN